jgi:hypothetical protein
MVKCWLNYLLLEMLMPYVFNAVLFHVTVFIYNKNNRIIT